MTPNSMWLGPGCIDKDRQAAKTGLTKLYPAPFPLGKYLACAKQYKAQCG